MNVSKPDNYAERMQQPLVSPQLRKEFKNITFFPGNQFY